MKKIQPSTIPLQHYEPMPPSTSRNYYDNQYISLFGDPVQPLQQNDYLEKLDTQLYSKFRRNSSLYSTNLEDDEEFPKPDIYVEVKDERERPKTSRVLRSGISQNRVLNKENISHNYNLKIVPENARLFNSNNLGPDIRILSDSGTSSSENLQNFGKNQQLSNLIPLDTTYTIHREPDHVLRNNEENSRKLSQDMEGFSDFNNFDLDSEHSRIFSNEPSKLTREFSNESYSSSDWFKPSHDYQEFTKIPKLRPSSKNVMSINKPETNESPVATLLNDSNGSSSDEKLPDQKIYSDVDSIDKPFVVTSSPQYAEVHHPEERVQPIPQPRKLPIQMSNVNEIASNMNENFASESIITSPLRRAPSPAILTSTIYTGADFRVQAPKSHKTKSFSIIAESSNPSSLIETPPNQQKEILSGRISPFLGRGFKEPPRPPPRQKRALTSTNLKLPTIANTSDDSPRPSVQFDITANSTEKIVPRSILHRPSISTYGMPPIHPQNAPKIKSFETLPNISGRNIMRKSSSKRLNNSSIDISGESRSNSAAGVRFENPTSREKGLMRIINSADSSPSRIPIKSNWLPTSLNDLREEQPFLLPPRRDRRKSSTSTERRSSSQTDHRNSITSDRRSSNMSSVTTSDFSFRRNSLSPPRKVSPTNFRNLKPLGRRKSISLSPINLENHNLKNSRSSIKIKKTNKGQRRIAKPTTLSPILGTPNKDDPLSPEEIESSTRFISNIPRTDSLTRIPIRNGSNLVLKPESQINLSGVSNVSSRSASPQKEFAPVSRPNSRADIQAPVKVTNRSNSRVSTSRTSRPASRADSKPPSRTSSRASSHQSNNNVSRSNSRLSISPPKSKGSLNQKNSVSKKRSPSPKKSRKKSVSPNKSTSRSRTRSRSRSRSKSPEKKSKVTSRQRQTKKSKNSSSESPKRSTSRKGTNLSAKSSTNDNKKNSTKSKTSSSSSGNRKNIDSKTDTNSFRRSGSNIRKEGLTRESSSIRKKEPLSKREPSNLKREPSNLKREPSKISLRKDNTSMLKREPSSVKSGQLKKEPSNMKIENTTKLKREPSNLIKTRTDSNLSKKLESKNNTKIKEKQVDTNDAVIDNIPAKAKEEANGSTDSNDKLIPLTKQNVVSMTTAAITAQPVQITTAVTNHIPVMKTNSSGQLIDNKGEALPSVILEKSQKTLENIQKTVTEATDEIHKTINENLTDLKSLETDMGKGSSNVPKVPFEKADSLKTIQENPKNGGAGNSKSLQPIEASVSVVQGSDHLQPSPSGKNEGSDGNKVGEDMAERVSERAISVLPDVECESANLQTNDQQVSAEASTGNEEMNDTSKPLSDTIHYTEESGDGVIEHRIDEIRAGEDNNAAQNLSGISQEHLDEDLETTGCCGRSKCCKRSKCCTRLCMPCRRARCCRKKQKEAEEAIIKEVDDVSKKTGCWKGLNCCKRKQKTGVMGSNQMETIAEETDSSGMVPKKQNKCGLCLRKFFCCRATNKIETTSTETEETRKCCFCIPCRRKRPIESRIEPAWQAPPAETSQRRESILSTPAGPPESRCTRIMNKLKFWKKKEPSRRASMGSRKQSLAPTNPPEDTRPKLHNDLVEYNSKMKGAIPVLPIYLAYFCTGCNIICPGLGTILSGLFCLCVGIPRFSQYDSAKARIGSFVINCIVGVSQLFCVLFCFVGWGWSIWWGTIMMRTARKLQKIRKVERLEVEEEQRQAQAAAAAATATATGGKPNDKDVEAGKA